MEVDFVGEVKSSYSRSAPNGTAICDFTLSIPTTVKVDRDSGETRRDTINAFIYGDWGEQYLEHRGRVRIKGDLRINRFQKDGVWACKPEIAIRNFYIMKDK
jgi:hypothetical protein